nr:pyridoxamine 5'-phosphate oxidase family protein [uncultured Oscillibacter sp.]
MRDPEKTIGGIVDKAKLAFLSYLDAEGFPTTRAMLPPREREGIRVFWFSTNTSSRKVAAFRDDPRGSIYFVDRRFFRGVSLSGTVEVLEDPESKRRLWQTGDTLYYPGGVTDPDYCVLRFTAVRGRYYSDFKSEDLRIPV